MAENTVNLGKSPEEIAYQLFLDVARVEKKDITSGSTVQGTTKADRDWILSTYAECVTTVRVGAR